MFTHLHVRSWFSFLRGASSPETIAQKASALGMKSCALTDVHGVYGAVRFQRACSKLKVRPIIGCEVTVDDFPLVLIAQNNAGYSSLNRLLTTAHLNDRLQPRVAFEQLQLCTNNVICLTGGREGKLRSHIEREEYSKASEWVVALKQLYASNLFIELSHHCRPKESVFVERLHTLSTECGIPCVASGDVRYAEKDDYALYDVLTCTRLGYSVFEDNIERPVNDEAYLQPEEELRRRIPYTEAFTNTALIADCCSIDLLPGYVTPPRASLPDERSANQLLRDLCESNIPKRYTVEAQTDARALLEKELSVICSLELAEFFLVVREVTEESKRRGIRCSGRGSAANSIVAYLLGITGVDPVRHKLLFERFLHSGRKGTPDIDVDFDSDRRNEIITWMEERFGMHQTAMTATLITYRLRSALRDVAKALGYPMPIVNKLGKAVPSRNVKAIDTYIDDIAAVIDIEAPLYSVLSRVVKQLSECPRHLGLHSGGMVLSRLALHHLSPIQQSANGVKEVQFDKNDVEAMGLVKLDVLGLRMLATVSEAVELLTQNRFEIEDIDELSLEDSAVYDMICRSETIGVFQIESQGQMHVLAQHQPRDFNDLIAEVALFRPGPLQGGMVNPYIRRRRGLDPVEYMHEDLKHVLGDTYGVILFQEQVLEVAHHFAGMSLADADDFRSLMSKFRDAGEMEHMRTKFVSGAVHRGVDEDSANMVFNKVAYFVGYGFCRSHAAAFAKIVYQSAWLKLYYPHAYMAAVMQHRPGFYSLMSLEEEARRLGVPILLPDINISGTRYAIEQRSDGKWAIRKPLSSVAESSETTVRAIVLERLNGEFSSVEELCTRVEIPINFAEALAQSGALDSICSPNSRDALWQVGVVYKRKELQQAKQKNKQSESLFELPLLLPADIPHLAQLHATERLAWDYASHSAARVHPVTLYRRVLNDLEIRPIETCKHHAMPDYGEAQKNIVLTIGGIVVLRQSPQTAKGVMFVTLEDETGFIQTIVLPHIREKYRSILRAPALIMKGKLEGVNNWRGLLVSEIWELKNVSGGYSGYPSPTGGKDTRVIVPLDEEILHNIR